MLDKFFVYHELHQFSVSSSVRHGRAGHRETIIMDGRMAGLISSRVSRGSTALLPSPSTPLESTPTFQEEPPARRQISQAFIAAGPAR
jgi:hypothetical protein